MKLPNPPVQYNQSFEAQRNASIEQMDQQSLKHQTDIEIVTPQRLILRSPNGTQWKLVISNLGVLTATAL
ncbi:hypothetical protein UFOVP12_12 [uncultured Caudovirales phage]|uniref:Uncharacterized protein n=1 Tax=uncultured Caudovirales phage TaxID=2100421 RepID=A0A6J5KIL0_9CAUD|nr:hypothetical protein UFOVP12_12 [uncultured Caudovirales phage]